MTPKYSSRSALRQAKAGDDLVEDQQRADAVALARADPVRKPGSGATRFMFAATGSTSTAATSSSSIGTSLYGATIVSATAPRGDAGRTRQSQLCDAAAARDEQRVGVAVVAAVELHDLVALVTPRARRTALINASVPEETSRTCSSPGTRARHRFGEQHFARGRRAEGRALADRFSSARDDDRDARDRGATRRRTGRSQGSACPRRLRRRPRSPRATV